LAAVLVLGIFAGYACVVCERLEHTGSGSHVSPGSNKMLRIRLTTPMPRPQKLRCVIFVMTSFSTTAVRKWWAVEMP
jgi:hypothetical protein